MAEFHRNPCWNHVRWSVAVFEADGSGSVPVR